MLHSLSKCVDKLNKAITNLEKHFKCEASQAHTGITCTPSNHVIQEQSHSIETVSGQDRWTNNCSSRDNAIIGTLPSDGKSESVKLLAANFKHKSYYKFSSS